MSGRGKEDGRSIGERLRSAGRLVQDTSDKVADPGKRELIRRGALLGAGLVVGEFTGYGVGNIVGRQEGKAEERRPDRDRKLPVGRFLSIDQEKDENGQVLREVIRVSNVPLVIPASFRANDNGVVIIRNMPGPVPLEIERNPQRGSYLVENIDRAWDEDVLHRFDMRPGAIRATSLIPVFGYPIDLSDYTSEVVPPRTIDYAEVEVPGAIWYALGNDRGEFVTPKGEPIGRSGDLKRFFVTAEFVAS